jgi:hypothetical protein
MQAIVQLLLGYRVLRYLRNYEDDPVVLRLLVLKHLLDVATLSRQVTTMEEKSVDQL